MLTKEYWDSLTDQEKWDWAFNASVELTERDECADAEIVNDDEDMTYD